MNRFSVIAFALATLMLPAAANAQGSAVNGILKYRGFAVDMTAVKGSPTAPAVEAALKKQLDIVADCGAKAEILAFFRTQTVTLAFGKDDGGGNFSARGVEIDATPQPPEKPVILHEFLHALHARSMPNGVANPDVERFYETAMRTQAYPAGEYVLKNQKEFFAVTGSLYLWGFVARAPHDRATLKAKQPVYYAWLGQLFGVQK